MPPDSKADAGARLSPKSTMKQEVGRHAPTPRSAKTNRDEMVRALRQALDLGFSLREIAVRARARGVETNAPALQNMMDGAVRRGRGLGRDTAEIVRTVALDLCLAKTAGNKDSLHSVAARYTLVAPRCTPGAVPRNKPMRSGRDAAPTLENPPLDLLTWAETLPASGHPNRAEDGEVERRVQLEMRLLQAQPRTSAQAVVDRLAPQLAELRAQRVTWPEILQLLHRARALPPTSLWTAMKLRGLYRRAEERRRVRALEAERVGGQLIVADRPSAPSGPPAHTPTPTSPTAADPAGSVEARPMTKAEELRANGGKPRVGATLHPALRPRPVKPAS